MCETSDRNNSNQIVLAIIAAEQAQFLTVNRVTAWHMQEDYSAELDALKEEGEMPIEDFLKSLPTEMLSEADDKSLSGHEVGLFTSRNFVF